MGTVRRILGADENERDDWVLRHGAFRERRKSQAIDVSAQFHASGTIRLFVIVQQCQHQRKQDIDQRVGLIQQFRIVRLYYGGNKRVVRLRWIVGDLRPGSRVLLNAKSR